MRISIEAIVGLLGVFVGLSPAVLVLGRLCQRGSPEGEYVDGTFISGTRCGILLKSWIANRLKEDGLGAEMSEPGVVMVLVGGGSAPRDEGGVQSNEPTIFLA